MTNRTFRVIIILVALLFLNIEAAHAGLVYKLKLYIRHEFSSYQLFYIFAGILILSSLLYIVFTPILIGKERWSWLHYYTYNPYRHRYQSKRVAIKKISAILKNAA